MRREERATLRDLIVAVDALSEGLGEARDLMHDGRPTFDAFGVFDAIQRTAARAFLKAFEQFQDVIAKLIRLVLVLEDEDLTGLSARAIAERAETIELIGSAERWSALVRLRNRLVHEYPLTQQEQFDRLLDVWDAHSALFAVSATIHEYLRTNDYDEVDDD